MIERAGGRPAVFLDRDGTLIEDVRYLNRIESIALYPWSIDAVRALNRAGLAVVVVTNQSGVARRMFDEAFVAETHRTLDAMLAAGGARIDGYYYCLHHPDGEVPLEVQAERVGGSATVASLRQASSSAPLAISAWIRRDRS